MMSFSYCREHHGDTGMKDQFVHVQYDGSVHWHYPAKVQTNCEHRANLYPSQNKLKCKLHLGSVIYTDKEVDQDYK